MDFCMQTTTQLILNEMRKKKNESAKNVIMSPLSMNLMLNMVASGSEGKTLEQFLKFLGSDGIKELNNMSSVIMSLLLASASASTSSPPATSGTQKPLMQPKPATTFFDFNDQHLFSKKTEQQQQQQQPLFSLVNALWVDKRFQLIPSFKEITETIYKAKVENVDLCNEADHVKKAMNSWVENETKGLIKELLPESVELEPPLCLANALYFKGAWEDPFDASMTRDNKFHLLNGRTIQVPFMNSHNDYLCYASNDDYKVLKLRYQRVGERTDKQIQFSMYILLPHDRYGLQDMVEKFNLDTKLLTTESLNHHLRRVELSHVSIPKLKFSYDVDAKELLEQKGLTFPFSEKDADFSNMVYSPAVNVYIGIMLHKSCIEVNEEGTEAAADTFAGTVFGSSSHYEPPPLQSFVADHPFMFMVVEEFSQLVLFTGAVLDLEN